MQNREINIATYVKIIALFIIICILFMAKSIFLVLFVTTFTIISTILTSKSVNIYIEMLKKAISLLLFVFIVYIIFSRDIVVSLIFLYKMLLSIILLKNFILVTSFRDLVNGLYTLLLPFKKIFKDLEKTTLNIIFCIIFLKNIIVSNDEILKSQKIKGIRRFTLKHYFIPKLFFSMERLNYIENILQLRFLNLKRQSGNFSSNLTLILFLLLFVVALFKEVIL